MPVDKVKELLENAEEVYIDSEGEIISKRNGKPITKLKPQTWFDVLGS
jgi:hypothetical protein